MPLGPRPTAASDAAALERAGSAARRLAHDYYDAIGRIPTPRDIDLVVRAVVVHLPKPPRDLKDVTP